MKNAPYLITILVVIFITGSLLIQKAGNVNANPYLSQISQAFKDITDYLESSATASPTPKSSSINATTEPIPKVTIKNLPKNTSKATNQSNSTIIINGKTVYDGNDIQPDEVSLDNINQQNLQPTTYNLSPKSCYRFTVPHLDGSSSALCYSQSDYNQLASLHSQYNSAKANYEFELRVAEMYDDPNSDFFQQSADEAKQKAQQWKDKMGEIALAMYNIEKRGW